MAIPKPHPTLIIGLGGTGQWVTTHVLAELLSLYGVQDPKDLDPRVQILSIDTDFNLTASVGSGVSDLFSGMNVGERKLPEHMVVRLGANVVHYVQAIAEGKHKEIGAWFDAKWFLNQPQYATLLNLTQGAGQYRPLGRIAVPYNLTQGGGSLSKSLRNAITEIKDHLDSQENTLTVCIAGSLCGGTGAGMFVDIAHLVKQLAAPLVVRASGYLVLPNAFEGTVPPAPDGGAAFRQRAFAAMRELRRFSREVNYEVGYPMHYASQNVQSGVLRSQLNKTLFELLYYFDAPMVKADRERARLEEGVAPAIAEAIMLWVDGRTGADLGSHAANLNQHKASSVAHGMLHPQAAVAGAMGIYSLQLPIHLFVEEWTHELALEVLDRFLGVKSKDAITHRVTDLRIDRAGDEAGMPGKLAARRDWEQGQVGGMTLSAFLKELLVTGREAADSARHRERREQELKSRSLKEWEERSGPASGWSDDDAQIMTEFLDPQKIVLEKSGFLGRRKKLRWAEVRISKNLPGDAAKREKRNPKSAAVRIDDELKRYFNEHLGPKDEGGRRGGSESEPEGLYPRLLRETMEQAVSQYQKLLAGWVAEKLNGVPEPQRTVSETVDRALKNRAAKLGFTLDMLDELTRMFQEAVGLLRSLEREQLGRVADMRSSDDLAQLRKEMEKRIGAQEAYLKAQQKLLEMERQYAVIRANRWAATQMLAYTKTAKEALEAWRKVLAEELYAAVWKGKDQVTDNLRNMERYSAVREVINFPGIKRARYQYYAQQAHNALAEVLNDLRWQVTEDKAYDSRIADMKPVLKIGLQVGGREMSLQGPEINKKAYLDRCRAIFEEAREHETVLGWLMQYYDGSTNEREITTLAQRLSNKGRIALRLGDGANPYRLAYVRSDYADGSNEASWLKALVSELVVQLDASGQDSQPVKSSDPYRLTFLAFDELIDVEKLTAYQEGKSGIHGAGGYMGLPAESDGVGLAKQLLHVFSAEQNAVVYEERLGRDFTFSDKIVALLEDRARFLQFVQIWLYGRLADERSVLLHPYRLPDDETIPEGYRSLWVRRLTVGPFPGELDEGGEPLPAQHYWLTEPRSETPSLYAAADSFCLGGVDKWQKTREQIKIPYRRVQRQIAVSRMEMIQGLTISEAQQSLLSIVESMEDEKQRREALNKLQEHEYLKRRHAELEQNIAKLRASLRDWRTYMQGADDEAKALRARQITERELDLELLQLMRLVIADEMKAIRKDIQQQRPRNKGSSSEQHSSPSSDFEFPLY